MSKMFESHQEAMIRLFILENPKYPELWQEFIIYLKNGIDLTTFNYQLLRELRVNRLTLDKTKLVIQYLLRNYNLDEGAIYRLLTNDLKKTVHPLNASL
jgi:hypothetical protein